MRSSWLLSFSLPSVAFLGAILAIGCVLGACLPAGAQELPAGVSLGMSPQALQQSVPGLERVARPQRLTGGLAGTWRSPPLELAGVTGQQTFFFQAGQLRRVEFFADTRGLPDGGATAFDRLVSWGRAVHGPELSAKDADSRYAAWTLDDTEVYAQNVIAPRPSVRLVYKVRVLKDASAL